MKRTIKNRKLCIAQDNNNRRKKTNKTKRKEDTLTKSIVHEKLQAKRDTFDAENPILIEIYF